MTGWVWENEKYVLKGDNVSQSGNIPATGNIQGEVETLMVNTENEYVEPDVGCHCADVSYANTIDVDQVVAIPLEMQRWMYRQMAFRTLDDLADIILNHPDELVELAEKRLVEGHAEFGCEMYCWDPETRRANLFEELADASVYASSGPLE